MSSFEGYALIIAGFLAGAFLIIYLSRTMNEAAIDVLLGVVRGIPLTLEHRWLTLLQIYLGMHIAILLVEVFLFFAFLMIAGDTDGSVQRLGYLAAAGTGFAFLANLAWGTLTLFKCMSVLRQAAPKSK